MNCLIHAFRHVLPKVREVTVHGLRTHRSEEMKCRKCQKKGNKFMVEDNNCLGFCSQMKLLDLKNYGCLGN